MVRLTGVVVVSQAGDEMASYMRGEHGGVHCVVLSSQALMASPWNCSIDLIEASDFEPPTLEYSIELVRRLESYLRASKDNVVLLMRINLSVACAVLALTSQGVSCLPPLRPHSTSLPSPGLGRAVPGAGRLESSCSHRERV